ncbi:DNA-directed RNA polymerases II, IV and V subunit 9A [Hordeum vulgare]|nr:DNA-directed RNA polymerases II, IV and V subunit 9A [Hordeum vulgare]
MPPSVRTGSIPFADLKEIAADNCVYKRVLRKSADEPKDTLKDAAVDPSLPCTKSVKCYNCGYPEAAYFQAPTKGERGLTLYFICCRPTCGHRWRDWLTG